MALLAPILVFGLVIFIHELGHFIAAKALGVYAPRFSIGFGPSIFKFKRGETQYVLAWLPLGGYVRMASRHDAEAAFLEGGNEEGTVKASDDPDYDPEAMIPFGPKPVPEERWFESKPLWARVIIMIAGVVMNVILAVVVSTAIVMQQGQDVVKSTRVGIVYPIAAAPQLAQLQAGDTIRAVNGKAVSTWNDVGNAVIASTGDVRFTTQRGDVAVPLVPGKVSAEDVAESVTYYWPPVIDSVVPNDPGAKAGVLAGDSVVSVDGKELRSWPDLATIVGPAVGKPLTFVVSRNGALQTLTITPKGVDEPDSTGTMRPVGKIGVAVRRNAVHSSVPLGKAIAFGWKITRNDAGAVFKVLHDIGSGQQSVKQLGGPVAITRAAVDAARMGVEYLFRLIALLSINVAVLNLLPIPILDGGQILINVLESAKGSPFSMRTREYILRAGLVAIGLIFITVMYNDTHAGVARLFGWVGKLFGA